MACDAFVRILTPNEIRLGMAIAAVHRYSLEPWNSLTLIVCDAPGMLPWNWQRYGKRFDLHDTKRFAQESQAMIHLLGNTEVLAVIDDDMLIYGPEFGRRGEELLLAHPEYGFICAHPTNESQGPCCDTESFGLEEIIESHSVGGAGFVRKGIITDFPPIDNAGYDGHIDRQLRAKGLKEGYFRDLSYLHLGSRYSVSSPAHCGGYEKEIPCLSSQTTA
jgi:hypothetical protein